MKRDALRTLAVSNLYPPQHGGGYGILCQRICEGLARRGHCVSILTSAPGGTDLALPEERSTLELGIRVTRGLRFVPPTSSLGLLRTSLANHRAVTRALRQTRPDLVYCFGIDGVGFDVFQTAMDSGLPVVTMVGDTWLGQAWRDLARFDPWVRLAGGGSNRATVRLYKRVLGFWGRRFGLYTGSRPRGLGPTHLISRFLVEDLRESGAPVGDAWDIVPTPIPDEYFTPTGDPVGRKGPRTPSLRALFVSRMEWLKGPDTAVEGLSRAVARGADVTLTFCGLKAQEIWRDLEDKARKLGVAERVRLVEAPTSPDLADLYRRHDVFLFPSRIVEGFGIVNAEAMACGLPVLGVATSGAADVIHDGRTGFRFPPGDAGALGDRLCQLAEDRDLLERLSRGALQESRRHNLEAIVAQVERSLTGTLRRQRGGASSAPDSGVPVLADSGPGALNG